LYRKFTASHIFTGTTLLTGGYVLITTKDGSIIDLLPEKDAGDAVEKYNGILCPGFINTHCHLELSHLKNTIPEKTGLVDFVFAVMTQRGFDTEIILKAIQNAEDEMLQNGILAVGDICNTADTIQQKLKGRLYYHNFIEVAGFVPAAAASRFNTASELWTQFQAMNNGQRATIVPHAPYSVSPQLFELINSFAGNNLVSMHNQESLQEDIFFKTGTGNFLKLYEKLNIDISFYKPGGKSSLQTVLPYFNKNQSLILVHDVTTTTDDIKAVKQATVNHQLSTVFFCLCPNANLYISNMLPDMNTLVSSDCTIVLGTDSLASNHQLSILEEMKTLHKHFPQLPLQTVLQWATFNGAKALQLDNKLGSFEKGKQPGVVIIENADDLVLGEKSVVKRII